MDDIITLNGKALRVHDNGDGTYSSSVFIGGNGSDAMSAPPTIAVKSVGTAPTKACVGATELVNRIQMLVYNDSVNVVEWSGDSNVVFGQGFPIQPGDSMEFAFLALVPIPIYLVSSVASTVRVVELK